jgi:hypothetical protein
MRRIVNAGAVMCGLTLAACEPVTALPFPSDAPPTAFALTVSGFGFGSHSVTLRNDTLVIDRRREWRPDSASVSYVVPTRAQWGAFWRAADAAEVRAWPPRCENTRVADGGGFTLDVAYDGGRIASQGTNSYPTRGGDCGGPEGTREYRELLAAVSTLIGRPYP